MLNFEFVEPMDLVEFTEKVIKEIDKLVPDATIKLALKKNGYVTSMSVWVDDSDNLRERIESSLENFGLKVAKKPLLL